MKHKKKRKEKKNTKSEYRTEHTHGSLGQLKESGTCHLLKNTMAHNNPRLLPWTLETF